ncbi:esterase OVCA2-like isoform X2 [Anneissia japonica]|uniref:esterase OVCA2-like isoform X2 n=1 Tax=Anneissia japonica TaxID=1529436 RepID=UPI001425802B|nr:esterase OVCA2-like isoform X2 [Anneissia japonica]
MITVRVKLTTQTATVHIAQGGIAGIEKTAKVQTAINVGEDSFRYRLVRPWLIITTKMSGGAAGTANNLLKILCIHGYRQNAKAFREKTGSLRKALKKQAEFVYIDAPNAISSTDNDENVDQLGWWFSKPNQCFNAREDSTFCEGYEESVQVVVDAVKEHGPFDGILGFSQGASMVSFICSLQCKGDSRFSFDFAILVAGFKSLNSMHDSLYDQPITIPTLHVFGDTDNVIPKEMSEQLLKYFVEPQTLGHSGGHFVPASSPQKKVYVEFLSPYVERKLKNS